MPVSAPIATQDDARKLLSVMVRDCGTDIVRMQSSFEMYLKQYLQDFPDEQLLFLDAFKVGIPQKIVQHAGEPAYADYLRKLGPRFAEAAERPQEESAWAVESWAIALGRSANYIAPEKLDKFYAEDHIDVAAEQKKEQITYVAMTIIVTAGGFIGGAGASLLLPIALYASGLSDYFHTGGRVTGQYKMASEEDQIIFFALMGLVGGAVSALAAFGGWWVGKGEENPWASFNVACVTAFTMFMIAAFIPLSIIGKPILLFTSVFAATYKSSARGGMY